MRVTRHKRQILVFSGGDSCAGGGPDRVGRADFVSGPGTGCQAGDRSARRGCGPIGTRTNRAARESQITRGQAADERPLFRGSRHRERPEGHLHRKAVGRPLDLSLGRRAGHHGIEPIRGLSPGWRDGRTGEGFAERITRRRAAEELDARRDHFRGRYGHQSGQRRRWRNDGDQPRLFAVRNPYGRGESAIRHFYVAHSSRAYAHRQGAKCAKPHSTGRKGTGDAGTRL